MSQHRIESPVGQRLLWEEGRQPGSRVVALATVVILLAVVLELTAWSGPGVLFDLVFVAVCVGSALLVRPSDFFTVGVMPPLLMLGVFLVLGITRPGSVARADDGAVQAVVSGLSHHSIALGVGYGLCLAVLGVRDRFLRGALRPGALESTLRSGPGRLRRPASPRVSPATSPRRSSAPRGSHLPR